ncbi:uncharacterized protein BJX67DRAFT_383091 [Aspergillus lucknowensis]|uniref:DUF7702 domain-containing protein n=1 Tax=Aspergillus lucknowensis TaxID=176173 RepID=A0ABR4LNZ2_9EURO
MAITPHQSLALAIIIYYVPSLIPTSLLLHRHSLGNAWGWLYLFLFTVLRILGASLQFASEDSESENDGLRKAAGMLASIGVMTLLLGMLEVIESVKPALPSDPTPPRLWTLLHLSQYAAFILSIVYTTTGKQSLSHAAAVIVTCLFVLQAGIAIAFYVRLRRAPSPPPPPPLPSTSPQTEHSEEPEPKPKPENPDTDPTTENPTLSSPKPQATLLLLNLSTPFLATRVTYMLLASFTAAAAAADSIYTGTDTNDDGDTGIDTDTLPDVYMVAFMQYTMECVVFALFVGAGFLLGRSRARRARSWSWSLGRGRGVVPRDIEGAGSQVELRGGDSSV